MNNEIKNKNIKHGCKVNCINKFVSFFNALKIVIMFEHWKRKSFLFLCLFR